MKNKESLYKLAYLEKGNRIHRKFDFGDINGGMNKSPKVPNCGSAGCLLGELPGVDRNWFFSEDGRLRLSNRFGKALSGILGNVSLYFDIPESDVIHLFIPEKQMTVIDPNCQRLTVTATMKQVQGNLISYLKLYDSKDFGKMSKKYARKPLTK